MANSNSVYILGHAIRRTLLTWALPRITELLPGERKDALKRARNTDFDTIEWIGLLAGTAFTTYLLRFDAEQAAALSLSARHFVQFLAAIPLLVLFVGPFYLRRTRRGLDREIERRRGPNRFESER